MSRKCFPRRVASWSLVALAILFGAAGIKSGPVAHGTSAAVLAQGGPSGAGDPTGAGSTFGYSRLHRFQP